MAIRAVIFGLAGTELTDGEKSFFQEVEPLGFIVFARNIDNPEQLRALTADLRSSTGHKDTPILIDQEGGRVARMGAPHWRKAPAPSCFGACFAEDPDAALEAIYLNSRLFAAEQFEAGINVDCLPMLDVRTPDSNDAVIGNRAYSGDAEIVTRLGRAAADGLLDGGVLPVIKHMPGHGRARVDSHFEVPVVDASVRDLEAVDFRHFAHCLICRWG